MRKNRHQIHHLIWLVNTILGAGEGGIRRCDIIRKWRDHTGEDDRDYPPRTFINHKDDIRDIFGLDIGCRAVGKGAGREYYYYIQNPEDLSATRAQGWLVNTFSLKCILEEGGSMRGCISLEDIPRGHQWLAPAIRAVRSMNAVMLGYAKYTGESKQVKVFPYGLKIFRQRWYLIARLPDASGDGFRIYSLDRVTSMDILDETFVRDADWDIDDYFGSVIGIWVTRDGAETVELLVSPVAARYLDDLPLHASQRKEPLEDGRFRYTLRVKVTPDLVQELLRFRSGVEVAAPASLRETMKETIADMARAYGMEIINNKDRI